MAITIRKERDLYERKLTFPEGAKLYSSLRENIQKDKVLDRSYGYYLLLGFLETILFFGVLLTFFFLKHPILQIISASAIGFLSVRLGGLIHDAGHRAILKSSRLNDLLGYFWSLCVAFPFPVWQIKHNAHHANTNKEGEDPDLEVPISFTEDMYKRKNILVRFMRPYQAWLYFPLGSLVSFTMRLKAVPYLLKRLNYGNYIFLVFHILGIIIWYVGPFLVFPPLKAIIFFVFTNMVGGFYMLNIFAPNHKGIPQLEKETQISFLEHQIITSRNVKTSLLGNYLYMGLNYQIEHHLFPYCPRNNLHKVAPYVKRLCKENGLPYMEMGAVETGLFIVKELHNTTLKYSGTVTV